MPDDTKSNAQDASPVERAELLRRLHAGRASSWGEDPSVFDAALTLRTLDRVGVLFGPGRYFRLDVHGLKQLPPPPLMLVSNHSGGTTIPDVWGFVCAWYRHFGASRPLHLLAHEMVMATEATARYFARRGVLRASSQAAERALVEHGRDVLVMPGGELDTWRPWTRRYRVEFGGRTGYAKLARRTGVPIVPVAHAGAHDTLLVLCDGRALARAVGLQKFARAEVWPLHLSIPWGLALGPWPHLPLPVKLRYRIGQPIDTRANAGATELDDVEALDAQVRAAVQSLLDALAAE